MKPSSLRLIFPVFLLACDDGAPTGKPGHDRELSPEELAAQDSKADQINCAQWDDGTQDGTSLMVLVNKELSLKGSFTPPDLLPLAPERTMPGRPGLLRAAAREAFDALADAALVEAHVDFRARSTYRSFKEQCFTFDAKVREHGLEHAERYSARPGRSQHQLGTTVDITAEIWDWALEPEIAVTPEAGWLFANAGTYGFALSYPAGHEDLTGYAFEPWHYRYIGVEAAAELAKSGMILELYLRACADGDARFECPEEVAPEVAVNHQFIGGACATDADCASLGAQALCLVEGHPEGHCTIPCTRGCPDRPGNNQSTFCHQERDGSAWCRSRCDFTRLPDTGCREGYACLDGVRPNNAGTADVCLPDGEVPDAVTEG